jgi:hypothetical protein
MHDERLMRPNGIYWLLNKTTNRQVAIRFREYVYLIFEAV